MIHATTPAARDAAKSGLVKSWRHARPASPAIAGLICSTRFTDDSRQKKAGGSPMILIAAAIAAASARQRRASGASDVDALVRKSRAAAQ